MVRRHSLVSFFVLSFGMTWLAWSPFLLSENGLGLLHFRFPEIGGDAQLAGILPGAYLGPLSSAFIVTAIAGGRAGLREWRGRLFRWKFNWRLYAFAVAGIPLLLIAAALVMPGALEASRWPSLGVLWSGWHLPLFFTDWEPEGPDPLSIGLFILVGVTLSVVITWVFNRTQESLPAAMVIHAGNNTFFSGVFHEMFPDARPAWLRRRQANGSHSWMTATGSPS